MNRKTGAIAIAGREIGPGHPCFIIAEAGVNHNGSLDLAKQLVDAAQKAKADAVKFQTWITEKLLTADAPMAAYQKKNVGQESSQFEMAKQLELSYDDFREIKAYSDHKGILFFSTPDEEDSADFLDELGVPLFKIGSGEVTNLPFLRHVAKKGKPLILSTGMSTLGEVEEAVTAIEEIGNQKLILLHCVSNYPADPEDCNLQAIDTLRAAFQYPVGFSDHTLGTQISIAAVARGACVLEKHLTLDKRLPGPDHSMSLDVEEFTDMVQALRCVEASLGTGRKSPVQAEMGTKQVAQKSIVAARDIPGGKTLDAADLTLLRVGYGLPPKYLPLILGRKTREPITANQTISTGMLV
jgi:N-acetylneuraminate synthase